MPSRTIIRALCMVAFCLFFSISSLRRRYWTSDTTHLAPRLAPGIGFDLTTSYGTAVIRNHDGSFENVAKVQASLEYRKMMQRLSLKSSRHLSPPYRKLRESFQDEPRRIWRSIRRLLGLPTSYEVGLINDLIQQLRTKTEAKLGHSMDSVVVSFSHNVALYEEDIIDAIQYAQLKSLTNKSFRFQPHQLSAAFAGSGIGLCTKFLDDQTCDKEEAAFPYEQVLALSYTKDALEASLSTLKTPYEPYEPAHHHLIDWDSGHSSLATHSRPDAFWAVVRRRILELSYRDYPTRRITTVLLLGESSTDKDFQRVLVDALSAYQEHLPVIYGADPLFVAARGAAEFAKRAEEQAALWRGGSLIVRHAEVVPSCSRKDM